MQTKTKKNENTTNTELSPCFVVLRNGARVSDEEYTSRDEAKAEFDHWNKVITRWPDGSKLEIVNITKKGK
jgi:hypothetical protein